MISVFDYKPGDAVTYRIINNDSNYVAKLGNSTIKLCATHYGVPYYLLENGETIAGYQVMNINIERNSNG